MKRRDLLKAIGIGAVVAPAVVKAATKEYKHEEYSLPLSAKEFDVAMTKAYIRDNPYAAAIAQDFKGDVLMIDRQTGLLTKWEA